MKCKICGAEMRPVFKRKVFNKYQAEYFVCDSCEYLCPEKPYWLEETFKEDDIYDTGALVRNNYYVILTSLIIDKFFDSKKKYVDYAGGYGIFTRSMRDKGFDFYLDEQYRDNCFARGFEYDKKIKVNGITSFEVFEHFENPIKEMKKLLKISDNIIFSTELKPKLIPSPDEWWYYMFPLGQHISFYSEKTFEIIAKKFGLNFYTYKGIHILTKKTIPIKSLKKLLDNKKKNFKKIKLENKHFTDMLELQKRFAK
jgi:hypothetical protein